MGLLKSDLPVLYLGRAPSALRLALALTDPGVNAAASGLRLEFSGLTDSEEESSLLLFQEVAPGGEGLLVLGPAGHGWAEAEE